MGGEASLAPGFRFHPTDEELVGYYLKRKVCGKPFRFNAISEVDLYKSEPWDLPGQSRLKSRDLEWYFFGALDKKYGNGSRTNRATDQGYWKTTGKDRPVQRNNRTVGMKKTLVFHIGRAPRGERTNWVMHEYRLVDVELEKAGISQDAYVLCRIFQKSGSGPRNGEQYGAPLIEEEWDDNLFIPNGEVGDDAPCDVGDELYVQPNDLEQNTDMGVPSENVPVPLNFHYGDSSNHIDESWDFLEDDQQVFIGTGEKDDLPELPNDQKFFDLPESYQIDLPPVKDEYFVELNDLGNPVDGNYHANNPVDEELNYLDASHDLLVDNHTFLEVNDLQNPVEVDSSGFEILDEYLTYFDAIDNNLQYVALDSSEMLESKDPILEQSAYTQEVNRSNGEVFLASLQPLTQGDESASSSKQNSDTTKLESDVQYNEGWDNTLVKRVSYMLGSIPAPPAFAAEFPAKEAAIGQTPATHSPRSIHVTTGVIHISSMTSREIGKNWSLGKGEDVSLLLSCGLTSGVVMAAEQLISNSVGFGPMAGSLMMRSLLYLFFFWVLILSVSFKIGSCICTR